LTDNYAKIVEDNLIKLFANPADDLHFYMDAKKNDGEYLFRAFGMDCRMGPGGIFLDGEKHTGVLAILISLYALKANPALMVEEPYQGFKEFPDSMPYIGAFATHTEQILVPSVSLIRKHEKEIIRQIDGKSPPGDLPGDFCLRLFPLPKISLCYLFYEADEDFPAAVTCLYSNNAFLFMPIDGLADVGEYTSRRILEIIQGSK
jgi:hypothetical protein